MARAYSTLKLGEVLELLGQDDIQEWTFDTEPRPPSDVLLAILQKLDSFDVYGSEASRITLIDQMFLEILPSFPQLRIFKGVALRSEIVYGFADYLIAPKKAVLTTPLLCAVEAKQDDFEQGLAQCLSELVACMETNQRQGLEIDVYGVVSNGQTWQFCKVAMAGGVFRSQPVSVGTLPALLGALSYVCDLCAQNVLSVTG